MNRLLTHLLANTALRAPEGAVGSPPIPAELTPPPTTDIPEVPQGGFNASQAAAVLANRRSKEVAAEAPKNTEQKAVERPKEAAPAQESAPKGEDTEQPEAAPGETEGEDDGAGEPPIDPPRTWPKAEKEVFKTLPRETQQRLVEIDKARDSEIQKGLRENAERERALEVQRQAMEQARTQYEERLPAIQQKLQSEIQQKFGDIKSRADLANLARTNPARYVEFQALIADAQAATAEAQQVEARKRQEAEAWFETFTADEDRKFLEAAPEFADPKKADALRREAAELLIDKGFTEQEINDLWSGRKPALVRDHRFQLIIRDAMRYRAAQKAIPNAKAAPTQPSVKPGIPPSKGERQTSNIQTLQQKLARTGKPQDAVELLRAKRA